jgi:RNA-directed DNA polymerase
MLSIKGSMLYKVAQHPDKTFIGWAARGIDFLGFHLASIDFTVAKTASNRFVERIVRLYEQGADAVRIGQYARRSLIGLNKM